jgi:hypothetical protein
MPFKFANRVLVSTATTGTGTVTLGGALAGYQTFEDGGIANTDTVRYLLLDGNAWEVGLGTYTASGTTLSRDAVEESSLPANAKLSLSGGARVGVIAGAGDYSAFVKGPATVTNNYLALFDGTTGKLLKGGGPILGTVSQSGGVPTGAIFQRGKNANGEFARFADGTQKCWSYIDSTIDITTASNMGAGFVNATPIEWVFPVAFATDADEFSPIVRALSYSDNPRSAVISCSWSGPSSTVADKGLIHLHRPVSEAASAYGLYVEASGRWF